MRGFSDAAGGLPTAALADEILLAGRGPGARALLLGGNPIAAWPDQHKTHGARMQALELLVTLDIKLSATAQLAHYVIAPKLVARGARASRSRTRRSSYFGDGLRLPEPYAQYAPALVEPPAGSDVIEEWEFFYGLARELGLPLRLSSSYSWGPAASAGPVALDMQRKPTTDEIFELLCAARACRSSA